MENLEKGFPSSRSATAVGNQNKTKVGRKKLYESKTFQAYQLQILWKPIRYHHLLTGSFFELPGHYVLANLTDTDRMRVYASRQAVPHDAKLPENIRRQTLFIDTQESPVGFCRLRCPKKNRYFTRGQTGLRGPARKMLLSDWLDVGCKLSGGASMLLGFGQLTLDQVDAVFCPNWPSEATDWKTRTSLSGWPDKYLKDHILRGGCHLVAKSHHSEPNDDTLWRYSFSQAEIILIGSWNDVQKYIYHILRVIKGRVTKECKTPENSIFSSYLFKTLMLWACEKKAVEFWNEECIESSIAELLCEAIECLIDRECQHYFMPKVNILDQPTESDTTKEVSSLEERMCFEIQSTMRLFPKFNERTSFQVEINKNFVVHYKLRANTEYVINPFSSSFERYFDNELENDPFFRSDLATLFKGLLGLVNLELRSSKYVMRRVEYEETVNECFRSCLAEYSHDLFGAKINSNESFHMVANRIFNVDLCKARILPQSSCLSQQHTDPEATQTAVRKLQMSPIETEVGAVSNECSGMLSKIVKTTTHGRTCCYVRTPREWKGYSANTNHRAPISFANIILRKISDLYKKPCYLISRAYYANYYYTYHKNYQMALHLCAETLAYIEKFHNCSELQTRMHEDIFPVILSSFWMPLFDENIQVVFALSILTIAIGYSNEIPLTSCFWIPPSSTKKVVESHSINLHSVIKPSPPGLGTAQRRKRCRQLLSSVVLQVSAVEFMRYIGVQCLKQLNLGENSLYDMSARQPSERRLVQQSLLLLAAASFELPNSKL